MANSRIFGTRRRGRRAIPLLLALAIAPVAVPGPAWGAAGDDNIKNATRLLDKGDVRGAVIELRNASRAQPENGDLHLRLARLYLQLSNIPAAEAEARTARARGVDEPRVAPILAETLLRAGKFELVLKEVPVGDRAPEAESAVRTARGVALLALNQPRDAETMLRDAERLDPRTPGPKLGVARLLLAQRSLDGAQEKVDAALAIDPQLARGLMMKGDLLRMRGDLDAALGLYNTVLAREPENPLARVGRANLLIAKNDLAGAEKDVKAVLADNPNDLEATYLQALLYARGNQLAKASDLLQKISNRFTDFPAGLLLLGSVQVSQNQLAQAEGNLSKFVARVPGNVLATRMLAEVALRQGAPARALEYLQPVMAANQNDATLWALLANAYLGTGRSDKASEALDHATSLASDDLRLKTELAVARFSAGQTDMALGQLEKVFESQGGLEIAGPALILASLRARQVDKAATAAEEYVGKNPENLIAQNLLGLVRVSQNRLGVAEQIFRDIVTKHPEFTIASRNLAEVYLAQGRSDEAAGVYRDMLKRKPDDVPSLLALANVLAAAKDVPGAIDQLKQAAAASPSDPGPNLRLATTYAAQKDWKNALATMRGVQAQYANNLEVLDTMARIQLGSGDTVGSVATYRRATEVGATVPAVFERYAAALILANDLPGAREALRKAQTLDPRNLAIKERLIDIEYRVGGTQAAIAAAQALATKEDGPTAAMQWTADVLQGEGKAAEAAALLAEAERQHPSASLAVQHATILARAGDSAKGAGLLNAWLTAHPDDLAVRRSLADVHLNAKNYEAALPEFERINAASPNDPVVLNNLAWLYQRTGNPKARELAEKAYALAPLSPSIADTLGWVLLSGGDAKGGLQYLKTASFGMPQDPNVQYHLAVALSQTGQTANARTVLQQIVSADVVFDNKDQASQLLKQLGN